MERLIFARLNSIERRPLSLLVNNSGHDAAEILQIFNKTYENRSTAYTSACLYKSFCVMLHGITTPSQPRRWVHLVGGGGQLICRGPHIFLCLFDTTIELAPCNVIGKTFNNSKHHGWCMIATFVDPNASSSLNSLGSWVGLEFTLKGV